MFMVPAQIGVNSEVGIDLNLCLDLGEVNRQQCLFLAEPDSNSVPQPVSAGRNQSQHGTREQVVRSQVVVQLLAVTGFSKHQ